MKTLRVRAGLEREEFGRRIGYSASTIASYEQGRRIPSPQDHRAGGRGPGRGRVADGVGGAGGAGSVSGVLPGMATLETEAIELLAYDALVVKGLLQTEEYMRALFAIRRPALNH